MKKETKKNLFENDFNKLFNEEIYKVIKEKNITYIDLAKITNIDRRSFYYFFNHNRAMSICDAKKVCNVLGIDFGGLSEVCYRQAINKSITRKIKEFKENNK